LGYIPAHLFALKYFEELELELRLGQSYLDYKEKTPFLFPALGVPNGAERSLISENLTEPGL
jgi:hypothetical protein